MVPNPYTLLPLLGPKRTVYTVLELKDAFFCISLARESQPLVTFEWSDPQEGFQGQLTWTRPPQGFKNSPTIFDEALEDLCEYRAGVTLLMYVDDLLVSAEDYESCLRGTRALLQTAGKRVSGVSKESTA